MNYNSKHFNEKYNKRNLDILYIQLDNQYESKGQIHSVHKLLVNVYKKASLQVGELLKKIVSLVYVTFICTVHQ